MARQAAHDALAPVAAESVRARFPDHAERIAGDMSAQAVIAGYWPFRSELDPRPLMQALHGQGHRIALPVVVAAATPLRFRLWTPDSVMVRAGLGGLVPEPGAPEIVPDILLVPLLAFDDEGYRLGYGGGFYDRTLEALRADRPAIIRAVGIAYAAQKVPSVPREATDQRLDFILTEAGLTGTGLATGRSAQI